jgi:hypothetical protein
MVRLYLLGFTHDLKGVVFTQRKSGKQATFWVPIDETFLAAIDKLETAREDAQDSARARKAARAARAKARAAQERVMLPPVGRSQSSSALPASEIQQLLRQGRTVNAVVEAAKAPRAWVERLLEPVLAERVGVVRLAQGSKMTRSRLGRSGLPLGEAVLRNLQERRATVDTIEGLDDAWDARAAQGGRWRVWVKFNHRGKRRTAEWEFRKDTRQVTPRNRLGAQLGWWAPEPGTVLETIEALEGAEAPAGEEKEAARPRRRKPARRKAKRKPAAKRRPAAARRGPAQKATTRRPRRKPTRRRP